MSQADRRISVLIVDDHPLMREALTAALEGEPDLYACGAAINGQDALEHYVRLRPEVVIMDLMMPVLDGISAIAAILQFDPAARILVLTSAAGDDRIVHALAAGAHGYLLKDAERTQLLEGVRSVAAGDLYLPSAATNKLVRALQRNPHDPNHLAGTAAWASHELSQRQLDVLALAADGLTDEQIAARLVLSSSTVRVHLHHIIQKLGVADRGAAIAWYVQHHLDRWQEG